MIIVDQVDTQDGQATDRALPKDCRSSQEPFPQIGDYSGWGSWKKRRRPPLFSMPRRAQSMIAW